MFNFCSGSLSSGQRATDLMVGTPVGRRISRHSCTASILALRAIRSISPVRAADRRAERRRVERGRPYRPRLAVLREMREFFELPQPRRNRRPIVPPLVDPNPIVVVSSDTSAEDIQVPIPVQQPVIDLDSSLESLPNIDHRPQFQLTVEPLVDLGHLDITVEFPLPLQHQALREAYVLLHRLQLPPMQPLTQPPELPPCPRTPPLEQEAGWPWKPRWPILMHRSSSLCCARL